MLGMRRAAVRRAARSGAGRGGRTAPALDPDRARGPQDGARRRGRDAEDPRRRAGRARVGARAVRRRRVVAGDRAWSRERRVLETTSSRRSPTSCAPAASTGSRRCRRCASARCFAARAPGRRGAVRPVRGARDAGVRAAAPARDGQRRPAGRERPRRVPGRRARHRRGWASCSTTAASRAGRSRWSAASSAAPAPSG